MAGPTSLRGCASVAAALVLAAGLAAVADREWRSEPGGSPASFLSRPDWWPAAPTVVQRAASDLRAFVVSALLLLGMLRGSELRHRRARVRIGPGGAILMVGGTAALIGLALLAVQPGPGGTWPLFEANQPTIILATFHCSRLASSAVIGTFGLLLIRGRWRPSTDGLDRAGLALGGVLVVLRLAQLA